MSHPYSSGCASLSPYLGRDTTIQSTQYEPRRTGTDASGELVAVQPIFVAAASAQRDAQRPSALGLVNRELALLLHSLVLITSRRRSRSARR